MKLESTYRLLDPPWIPEVSRIFDSFLTYLRPKNLFVKSPSIM